MSCSDAAPHIAIPDSAVLDVRETDEHGGVERIGDDLVQCRGQVVRSESLPFVGADEQLLQSVVAGHGIYLQAVASWLNASCGCG